MTAGNKLRWDGGQCDERGLERQEVSVGELGTVVQIPLSRGITTEEGRGQQRQLMEQGFLC